MLKPEETNALVKLLAQSLASEENVGHEQSRMKMYAGGPCPTLLSLCRVAVGFKLYGRAPRKSPLTAASLAAFLNP